MKKKFFCLIITAAMLISGCGNTNEPVEQTTASETETTTSAESTSAETEETEQPTEAETKQDLYTLAYEDYKDYSFHIPNNEVFPFDLSVTGNYHQIEDRNTISFANVDLYARNSTNALAVGKDDEAVITKVNASSMSYLTTEDSAYRIEPIDPKFTVSVSSDKEITVDSLKSSYVLYPNQSAENDYVIYVNGFIRKCEERGLGDGKSYVYEIIIDPAYMHGIPLLSTNSRLLNFNINGTDITADTFMMKSEPKTAKYISESSPLLDLDDSFVYAKIELNSISVAYYNTSKSEGENEGYYDNTCLINDIELLSDDTDKVLENPYFIDMNKDPQMAAVYNALIDNRETLLADDTYGIVLLDLDFDGTPEVLDTHLDAADDKYDNEWTSDIDIYRIGEDGLKYIDTIYNKHQAVYDISNLLGIKTLEDGSKAWFSTSYKNRTTGENNDTDYLYILNGDTLEYTEVFTARNVGEPDENGNYEVEYYYMGEKIVPTVIKEEATDDDGPHSDTHFEWNGAYSYWGEMWELYGKARANYCADIETSYKMYSSWLSNIYSKEYNQKLERYELNDREYSYHIAYLVDEFFLGEYNSAEMKYDYYFLGDYAKPVIYLYPEEETEVTVSLDFTYGGRLTCTYPEYDNGWTVTAMPDGTLYDKDGKEYYCLYWEADGGALFDNSKGFCVKGGDTAEFLREKLMYIGLSAREANEFIIYWLPKMQDNRYNVITFHTDDYDKSVPLTLSETPDTSIRVFMTYYGTEEFVEIEEQTLPHYERTGFTLVEWGGSEE